LVVRRLTVGLRNPINYDAAETKDSRPAATYMQVRRLWPPGWRALCPEPWGPAQPHPRVRQDRRHDPKEQSRHHRGDRTATVERTPRRPQQQDPHDDPQSLWV